MIRLFIEITGSDTDGSITDSLFDYLNTLQQSGYRLSVHLNKGENSEIINIRTDDEYIDREKISNTLADLGE